jgi:hypothetical protein
MDRVAVLVDAGYFFAAGSALVSGSGNQRRDSLIFDANNVPHELDSKVLARCKGKLGQYLDDESRRKVRKYMRQRLRELAPKS